MGLEEGVMRAVGSKWPRRAGVGHPQSSAAHGQRKDPSNTPVTISGDRAPTLGPVTLPGQQRKNSQTHTVGLKALLTLPVLLFEGTAEVRLADGGRRCAGRVEVKHQGQWGTVCSDQWEMTDAAVVCRQLGCGVALEAPLYAHFGPGSGSIWMDDVQCNGNESALSDCTHNGWGQTDCDHSWDAGVTCSGFVRLVGGDSPCSGSLEVYDRDQWKAVCHSHFGAKAAEVVCRELQCGTALSVHGAAQLGEGAGPFWDRELQCVGNESTILFCPWGASKDKACTHSNGTHVTCTPLLTLPVLLFEGTAEVRLADGGKHCAGRVEVKHQGQWGTVCSDQWDMSDAAVVCRQLGCGVALEAPLYAHFGPGSGSIWMDDVDCNGNESALSDCTHNGWGQTGCDHSWDAGVTCSGFVRLVGGDSPCSGSLEVYDRDQWKAVCHSHFGAKAAEVVCRELQCGTALSVHGAAQLGEGAGPFWDRELQCVGNESTILFCPWGASKDKACTHSNGTHVTCTQYTGFRLVNGSTACEGRVEVEVLGTWGTLCASCWDLSDAHVLCRHLGCGFAESIPGGGHFGRGTGPVWRDSFHCDGTEAHLGQCPVTALGASPCSQENAAAVICSGPAHHMSVRLVGGESRCDGLVEVFQHGTWGRVLDEQWDMQEASVVCQQLQCGEAEAAYTPVRAERGRGPVGLRGVQCAGHEADLSLCNTSLPQSMSAAEIMEDVGVVCRGDRRVRLVDGAGRCAGRVEIYYQGRWGTVCDDAWDLADAAVVCRQLGCGGALEAAGSARFGEGSGQIWLDGVNCSGAEAALWDCPAKAWGQHDCRHKEDAGVVCSEFMALRLENSDGCSGRLQVFYNGTWGSVCSNSMTTETVSLVCKELGCGNEGELETDSNYAKLSGIAWLDHVECGKSNSSFWQCPSAPWHPQSCDDRREETHITCNERPQVAACPNSTSCTDRQKIRTVGGKDGCSGRVEIWHRGTWGTLCDNAWDMRDAEVACRQLGCGPALYALGQAAAGEGTGPMWLMECRGTELSLQDCWAQPGDSADCQHKADAAVHCSAAPRTATSPPQADPPRGRPTTSSERLSVPVVICIILGALLCLLLALLAGQVRSARAQRRGSGRAGEPFPEAVYEEIAYSLAWEKQPRFSLSDVPVLPGGDPADDYDDAGEVSDPGEDPVPGQGDWEVPRTPEEGAGPMDTATGPPLKPVMAPLDDTPSLQYVNLTTLLAVISKLAEGALDQLPMSPKRCEIVPVPVPSPEEHHL
ncbi:scavenger receptor cysteine-rich type 1 protein M130-like [Anas platyrhynchos]|uniref:scavenger receptor cysteine-rich type 1 protein M130-like n=1 Tax=Anas platyrhynchos TaxID=8839 RepID=UPI003AF30F19